MKCVGRHSIASPTEEFSSMTPPAGSVEGDLKRVAAWSLGRQGGSTARKKAARSTEIPRWRADRDDRGAAFWAAPVQL